jgi:CSLREA domain-containing protein
LSDRFLLFDLHPSNKEKTMKTKLRTCLLALVSLILLTALLVNPAPVRADSTITVNSISDNVTSDGLCTLREAINNANANSDGTGGDCTAGSGYDTILFDISLGTTTITLVSQLPDISDSNGLTIDGDNRITLNGNDSVRVLYVNGEASGGGFKLQNISVTHARADGGGGLYNANGKVTIIHSTFSNNSSADGVGGGAGGGAYNGGGDLATMTITDSTFSNNSAGASGGGVSNMGGTLTIANSTFSNNSANYGGGVENQNGTLTLLNSTFSGNSGAIAGAAVGTWNNAAIPTTTIRNTILANSVSGVDCWNHATGILIGGFNVIETSGSGSNSCSTIAVSTADPMLRPLSGSPAYFPFNYGSPAIDAGDDAICAAAPVSNTSQNGVTRPQGVHCDIGAYEKLQITVNSTADNATASDGFCTLREAMNNTEANSDTTSGDCATGSNSFDIIVFDSSLGTATITLASILPTILDATGLMIDGDHRITLSGNDSVGVFNVAGAAGGGGFKLQNISVTHGSAVHGGGLQNQQGKVTIIHSTFSNNSVTGAGGGVLNSGNLATMTITDSTFSNNSAGNEGGGVDNAGATLTIANSTFTGNSSNYGGGVQNINGTLTLLNSTFSGNSATMAGGAVGTYNNSAVPTTTIRNTILANSVSGVDCWNHATGILIGGFNVIETSGSGSNSCSTIAVSTADPMLRPLSGSPAYFPLDYGSPALDTGEDAVCAAAPVNGLDQRGVARPQGTHCDIGSYEKLPNSAPSDLSLSNDSVLENMPAGTTVGTLTTTDADVDDTHTYSFACITPGVDDASFQILGTGSDELRTAAMFDYETKNSYSICIRTEDGHGGILEENFNIKVTDVPGLELFTPLDDAGLLNNLPTFDWGDFAGAIGYNIQISKNIAFSQMVTNANISPAISKYTPTRALTANSILYWRVRAKLTSTTYSAWSEIRMLKTANPPSVPTLSAPGSNALTVDYTPLFDWANSTLPTGVLFGHYEIQLATDAGFIAVILTDVTTSGNITASSYTPTADLPSNSKIYWHVRSYNSLGQYSAWSASRYFRTALLPPTSIAPGTVVPGAAVNVLTRRPIFTWNPVAGATGYTVEVSTTPAFSTKAINATTPATSYTHTADIAANTIFFWRVKANGTNGPSAYSQLRTFTSGNPPSVPTLSAPANNALVTTITPLLDWNNSTLPAGTVFRSYYLEIALDSAFNFIVNNANVGSLVTDSNYVTLPRANATTFYWRVRSVNTGVDGIGYTADDQFSGWSLVRSFRVPFAGPTLVMPAHLSGVGSLKPIFTWNPIVGATSYNIQISKVITFSPTAVNATVMNPTYTPLLNLTAGTVYYWRVRANGAYGPGLWSATFQFTTP